MLVACWSVKGGSGTTVVATALALVTARRSLGGALLADLAGDVPAVLGLPEPVGPGLLQWAAAGPQVGGEALARLEQPVAPKLTLLARGEGGAGVLDAWENGERLLAALSAAPDASDRTVFVDCGVPVDGGAAAAVASGASLSLLVVRPCYLALRRAVASAVRPSAVILVDEPGRALDRRDVEDALGVPVRAVVRTSDTVARAVDAGLLAARMPRDLARALATAAE